MSDEVLKKLGDSVKTWLPIIVTVGVLITGYFVFKAETRHQFEMQQVEMEALRVQLGSLREDVDENQRDWQRSIERQI